MASRTFAPTDTNELMITNLLFTLNGYSLGIRHPENQWCEAIFPVLYA